MKCTARKGEQFAPIKLELTLESLEEVKQVFFLFNHTSILRVLDSLDHEEVTGALMKATGLTNTSLAGGYHQEKHRELKERFKSS